MKVRLYLYCLVRPLNVRTHMYWPLVPPMKVMIHMYGLVPPMSFNSKFKIQKFICHWNADNDSELNSTHKRCNVYLVNCKLYRPTKR
jgi:hypothetical protein